MADDDWDDWGDDDNDNRGPDANPHLEANVEATQSEQEEEEEGWSWPADNTCNVNGSIEMFGRCSAASMADVPTPGQSSRTHATHTRRRQQVETLKEREAEAAFARQVDVVADKFFVELKGYLEDLADPSVREGINHELVRRDFPSLATYYDLRDDLADYTINTELQRMRYTIVTEEGKYLPFKKGGETQRSEDEENRALVGGVGDGDSVRDFLLRRKEYAMVRMANQSIFVDMLEVLQGRLLRPELEISVISRDCEFTLDFQRGVLEARSLFGIFTVGGGGSGDEETLEIAQIKGTAFVDTVRETCEQRLLSPELRMVFDDHMRASARALAHHALMDGGMLDGGAMLGSGGWGGWGDVGRGGGLHGIGSLPGSLVRASSGGMGRAAAAGTGLLANVVAGVGSAIGASRTTLVDGPLFFRVRKTGGFGTLEQDGCRGELGESAAEKGLGGGVGSGDPYLVTDRVAKYAGQARRSGSNDASNYNNDFSMNDGSRDGHPPTENETSDRNNEKYYRRCERGLTVAGGDSLEGNGVNHDDFDGVTSTVSDIGESKSGEDTGRRVVISALGMAASATGSASGAVLRGLWGGLQGVASAAGREGLDQYDGTQPIRLYRREGED